MLHPLAAPESSRFPTTAANADYVCSTKKQQSPYHRCPCGLYLQDLLGDVRSFKVNFERCITAGNDKHAGTREREQAASKAAALRSIIAPYFLRREKKEVLHGIDGWAHLVCEFAHLSLHRGEDRP